MSGDARDFNNIETRDVIKFLFYLATQKKLAHLGYQCLDQPLFSPNLAPSGYHHLFPGLKNN
jgi:hypothetical protein